MIPELGMTKLINGEEVDVVFSKETIKRMNIKYFKDNNIHKVNENHNPENVVNNVFMFESFIISDRVKSELYDLPVGTWVASYYVEDKDYWDKIKNGSFTGFSLEGMFGRVKPSDKDMAYFNKEDKSFDELYEEIMFLIEQGYTNEEVYEKINNKK